MKLVELLRATKKGRKRPPNDGEDNMHDKANQADWHNPGTFGMSQGAYSFSPDDHPGVLLPDEPDPNNGDDTEDQMVVVRKS